MTTMMHSERSGGSSASGNGPGLSSAGASTTQTWSAVWNELRTHQSLSSVLNDPRGKGLMRTKWEGVSDLIEAVGEIAAGIGEAREEEHQEVAEAAVVAKTDALIGEVPELPDFAPYVQTFQEIWDIYYRSKRSRHRRAEERGDSGHDPGRADEAGKSAASSSCFSALQSVPREYFSSSFQLEQHAIFKQPLPATVAQQGSLNEEMTGYLDAIEVSLFEHIREAQRNQVFESLGKLNDPLQEDLKAAVGVLGRIRGQLGSANRHQLRYGLAVGRLTRRRERMEEVLKRLDTLMHVRQSEPSIQTLLEVQDFGTCLELLESSTAALTSQLKGLSSAKGVAQRLSNYVESLDQQLEEAFVVLSAEVLFLPFKSQSVGSTAKAEASDSTQAQQQVMLPMPERLQDTERLKALCACLRSREMLSPILGGGVRDVLLSQLKKFMKRRSHQVVQELAGQKASQSSRQPSPPPNEEDGDGGAGSKAASAKPGGGGGGGGGGGEGQQMQLAQSMAALSFDSFLTFWARMLQDCLEVETRFLEYAVVIVEAAQASSPSDLDDNGHELQDFEVLLRSSKRPEHELTRLFDVLALSHLQKLGTLLQARQVEHAKLRPQDWKRIVHLTNDALDKVKQLQEQGRQRLSFSTAGATGATVPAAAAPADLGMPIKSCLYAQTKAIVEAFDRSSMEQLDCALDQERWERADVPSQYKAILEKLVGRDARPDLDLREDGVDRILQLDGVHFLVVPAVLTLLQLANDYVQLCKDFQGIADVVVQRLCSLLKLFNGKMHQLVLGGQAAQKHLKKIQASNLALASQCCSLMVEVLPKTQAYLERVISGNSGHKNGGQSEATSGNGLASNSQNMVLLLLADLTKLAADFGAHRTALFDKLSTLLFERYIIHSKKWFNITHAEVKDNCDAALFHQEGPPEATTLCPHEVIDAWVKDIMGMYRVLLKNLSGEIVRLIFAKAFEDVADKFAKHLSERQAQSTAPAAPATSPNASQPPPPPPQPPSTFLLAPSPPYEERLGRTLGDRLLCDVAFLREQLEKATGIATPVQHLISELVKHLCTHFMHSNEPLVVLHTSALESLQYLKRLPC